MTYQASKKTDFTVDLIWWGSLRLAPITNNIYLRFPIMLALFLMLSMTHYAQNYAGIISGSLLATAADKPLPIISH